MGAEFSVAVGVFRGRQVGMVIVGRYDHASLWNGTADSWVDLHKFLPTCFISSFAAGIWSDESFTYVVGYGFNVLSDRQEALLWTNANCHADFNVDGFVTGEDFDLFVRAFEAGDTASDFNRDGFITGEDFDAYVRAFESGC